MSTTTTETETRVNSVSMRSQPQSPVQEDDNVSQESYSTVAGTIQPGTSSTQGAQQKNEDQDTQQKNEVKPSDDSDDSDEEPSPCGRCRKMVVRGDEALACDICEQWFHIKCERVTKPQYKQQVSKGKSNFHWFCDTCNILQSGVIKQMTILKAEHSRFKERLDELEENKASKEDLQALEEKKADKDDMKNLEQRVTTLEGNQGTPGASGTQGNQGPSTSGTDQAKEVIKEIKAQEERKLNVIIFNLAEGPGQDNQDKVKHDKEEVKEIGKICQASIKKDDITMAKRLGKKTDGSNPRPLLITLSNDEKKKALFMNLKKLQTAPDKYQKISVRHDLTPKQQEEEKALREEAKKMEAELSGKEKCLVRGPPWARKIVKVPAQNKK